MSSFDVGIIGGGPGGYVAAIRAAQLGLSVCLIEKEHLGGVCLNWGCIPTKALLRSAEVLHLIQKAESFGITVTGTQINIEKMVERSRKLSAQLAAGIKFLLNKNKVTVVTGEAHIPSPGKIAVSTGESFDVKHTIIATGAHARSLPGVEVDGHRIWTARQAMTPTAIPESLLIIGSGAIGIEFASFYRALGTAVTVVEVQKRILPQEDEEISQLAQKSFEKQGIEFILDSMVESIASHKDEAEVQIKTPQGVITKKAQHVLVSVGIIGNTEGLGLEKTRVCVERGHIKTNEWCETDEPSLYAIGDVAGAPWLAHKASHEGILCVERIAGLSHLRPINPSRIPGCTYSTPQVASVGLTEARAKEAGFEVKVGRFPFKANGKALALGDSEGLVKTLFDAKTGELLGAHMIGAEVTELIQGFGIAQSAELTEMDLMHTIFPHPTLSEMMHEAVLDAYGQKIHGS